MMKMSKKLLSLLLCAIMVLGTTVAIGGEGFAQVFNMLSVKASASSKLSVGDTFFLGSYPQSKLHDSIDSDNKLIIELNKLKLDWKSFNFYSIDKELDKTVPGDWMRYADVKYKGDKYRAVICDYNRSYYVSEEKFIDGGYGTNNDLGVVTWFRYEPIEWRILNPDTGLAMTTRVMDAQPFDNEAYNKNKELSDSMYSKIRVIDIEKLDEYAKVVSEHMAEVSYENSSIRKWLNDDFYNTAFSNKEKKAIDKKEISNDSYIKQFLDSGEEGIIQFIGGNELYSDYEEAKNNPEEQDELEDLRLNIQELIKSFTKLNDALSSPPLKDNVFLLSYSDATNIDYCIDKERYAEMQRNSIWGRGPHVFFESIPSQTREAAYEYLADSSYGWTWYSNCMGSAPYFDEPEILLRTPTYTPIGVWNVRKEDVEEITTSAVCNIFPAIHVKTSKIDINAGASTKSVTDSNDNKENILPIAVKTIIIVGVAAAVILFIIKNKSKFGIATNKKTQQNNNDTAYNNSQKDVQTTTATAEESIKENMVELKFYKEPASTCGICNEFSDPIFKAVVIRGSASKEYHLCKNCAVKLKAKVDRMNNS